MSISVIIPAYNEADNLEELLPLLKTSVSSIGCPYEIIIVDTISPMDNTQEICTRYGVTYFNRENGNNYGDAIRKGIKEAKNKYFVIMDADGSHNPDDIKRMYAEALSGANLVIGSRYIEGGDTHNGFILKLMSSIVNLSYRLVFKIKIKDLSNSYRMYESSYLKPINLECSNFDIVEEIIIKMNFADRNIKMKEIPVYFNVRKYGKSKRDLKKFIVSYLLTMYKLHRMCMR